MQAASSLPVDLRFLGALLRRCASSGLGLSPEQCIRAAELLAQAAQEADRVVGIAAVVPELEDELLLVAGAAQPAPAPSYQAALKAQQAELQRQLDGGGPVHVPRPGLAALAMPIGDTNVVSFPRAPHPSLDGGGDAA
ncbi:hypothetical protein SAMN05428997_14811 [Bosea sp. CRIB-10]|uniref:hypothetical protein n=1 Tax=Bosea sp. CRIB-10 TaxID=378404 RepID=UPI0008E5128A|nr:hypothetical protein [Bosea sp. CRIB-10]SFD74211.1 hypothetical protein SAMN05428997_14811 [Bosea sp. CRIB-10]